MFKSQKITLKYEKPENICLNEVNKIMAKYKFCIIKGLVKPSEITVPMKKLKRYIKSNKDLPGIGEDPKKVRGPRHLYDIGGDYWFRYFKKKNYTILLSNTSITEISNKQIFKYIFAQLLKTISRIETYMFKNNMFYDPKWPYVGGWDLIVKKND
jgi:hypothetical protein